MVDIEHPAANCFFADRVLRLTLGADEQHVASGGRKISDELRGLGERLQCLLQVDNVDPVALAEDKRLHLRVPPTCLMAEVHSGLEQLFHLDRRHRTLPYRLENWNRLRAFG